MVVIVSILFALLMGAVFGHCIASIGSYCSGYIGISVYEALSIALCIYIFETLLLLGQ